jgi:hypothetical protein
VNWFWHALWICVVVIPVTIMWVACIFDVVLRRHDIVWSKRLGWLALVLLVPVIGALIYAYFVFGRPTDAEYRERAELGDQGALTDSEFEQQRVRSSMSTRIR